MDLLCCRLDATAAGKAFLSKLKLTGPAEPTNSNGCGLGVGRACSEVQFAAKGERRQARGDGRWLRRDPACRAHLSQIFSRSCMGVSFVDNLAGAWLRLAWLVQPSAGKLGTNQHRSGSRGAAYVLCYGMSLSMRALSVFRVNVCRPASTLLVSVTDKRNVENIPSSTVIQCMPPK